MERYDSVLIGEDRLVGALEELAFSLVSRTLLGQVVNTENHILRRNRNRAAVGGLQQVVGR